MNGPVQIEGKTRALAERIGDARLLASRIVDGRRRLTQWVRHTGDVSLGIVNASRTCAVSGHGS